MYDRLSRWITPQLCSAFTIRLSWVNTPALGAYGVTGLIVTLFLFSSTSIQKWLVVLSLLTATLVFTASAIPGDASIAEPGNYLISAAARLGRAIGGMR